MGTGSRKPPRSERLPPSYQGTPYPPPAHPEPTWPAALTVLAAILLQVTLPERLTVGPTWLAPALEGFLLLGITGIVRPIIEREDPRRRYAALAMVALVSVANIASLSLLTHNLLHHHVANGRGLIISGMVIWLTNVLIFALWYWELDRGGPGKRASGHAEPPDFLFTQMGGSRRRCGQLSTSSSRLSGTFGVV